MGNDVRWWKRDGQGNHGHQKHPDSGVEVPGDTDAADIVGRTGEEMPDVAHDGHDSDEEPDPYEPE